MKKLFKTLSRCAVCAVSAALVLVMPLSASAAEAAPDTNAAWYKIFTLCRPDPDDPAVIKHVGSVIKMPARAATCTEPGLAEGEICAGCGALLKAQVPIPASGHTWDDGKITTAPTFDSEGVKTYTCVACGEKITEAVPKLALAGSEPTELETSLPLAVLSADGSAAAYETASEDNSFVVTCAQDDVTLTGTLEAVSGSARVVFVTPQKRSSFSVKALTGLSADGDTFALTQTGTTASLTLSGWDLSYLLE